MTTAKTEMISLLRDAAEQIYDLDYNSWCNANTMRSFKEWFDGYSKSLYDRLQEAANNLENEEDESA